MWSSVVSFSREPPASAVAQCSPEVFFFFKQKTAYEILQSKHSTRTLLNSRFFEPTHLCLDQTMACRICLIRGAYTLEYSWIASDSLKIRYPESEASSNPRQTLATSNRADLEGRDDS